MTQRASCALVLALLLMVSSFRVTAGDEISRAPEQRPQKLFLSAHPSMFAPEEVFEGKIYRDEEFLPPEAYEDGPRRLPTQTPTGHGIQFAQYPIDDSAATDTYTRPEPRIDTATPYTQSVTAPELAGHFLTWKNPSLTTTVLPETSGGLGITTLDARLTIFSEKLPILQFKPRFSTHFMSGPGSTDLPSKLYDFAIDTSLYYPINDKWSLLGGVAPNMFTDFKNTSSDSVRITGRGLVFYQCTPQLKLAAGVIYLNRNDISLLPVAGLIYTPYDGFKVDLMFPKPKISYRFQSDGVSERWGYLAGEFGGGTWAIERTSGLRDVVTYRDYKLLFGVEHIQVDGYRWFAEAGYVFNRQLEYTSQLGDTDLGSTGAIRLGIVF